MAEAEKEAPSPIIDGVTAEAFHEWLYHHPCGRLFVKYLETLAEDNREIASETWLAGKGSQPIADEMRGVINTQRLIATLRFEQIHMFFKSKEEGPDARAFHHKQARNVSKG